MLKRKEIFGTTLFDGSVARKGYALNKMCMSFNAKECRDEFLKDEGAYCDKYGLNAAQKKAVLAKDILGMLDAGGNAYYLAKLAGIFKLDMQDIGALQTGVTKDEFKQKLVDAGRN